MSLTNSLTISFPKEHLYEYLLVAHPNEIVNKKILEEKVYFDYMYDQKTMIETKPNIAIASFVAKERMEEILLKWIQRICNLNIRFTVALNNFSGFPPHTIYLRIQDHQPFRSLANQLKVLDGFIQSYDCPPVILVTSPHFTIARKLPEYIYEKAISEYAHRSFHDSFEVNTLTLLKREDQYSKCQIVNVFTLPKD